MIRDRHLTEAALLDYTDGSLSPAAATRVAGHLARCPRCARRFRGYQAINSMIASPVPELPLSCLAETIQRAHHMPPEETRPSRQASFRLPGRGGSHAGSRWFPVEGMRLVTALVGSALLGGLAGAWTVGRLPSGGMGPRATLPVPVSYRVERWNGSEWNMGTGPEVGHGMFPGATLDHCPWRINVGYVRLRDLLPGIFGDHPYVLDRSLDEIRVSPLALRNVSFSTLIRRLAAASNVELVELLRDRPGEGSPNPVHEYGIVRTGGVRVEQRGEVYYFLPIRSG